MGQSRLSHMVSMNQDRIMQEAARRHARLQAADCSQDEQLEHRAWENEGEEQSAASTLARNVLDDIDVLSVHPDFALKLRTMTDQALSAHAPVWVAPAGGSKPWRWVAGIAASVAMAAVVWQFQSSGSLREIDADVFATTGRAPRVVTLDDGSVVDLDVDSRIAVRMSGERRDIELLSGRAVFAVAHDASRPFTVTADGSRTTALGTHFQVAKQSGRIVVTLAEGSVAVEGQQQPTNAASWQERLRPGEQLSIDTATAERALQVVDPLLATSWTHGRHVFRGTPLVEALEEVNRYALRKVRLGDASLADLPVAGNFVAGDSVVVVDAFAAVLPLRIVEGGDQEIILFRRYGE